MKPEEIIVDKEVQDKINHQAFSQLLSPMSSKGNKIQFNININSNVKRKIQKE